jgi:hypothetical protein
MLVSFGIVQDSFYYFKNFLSYFNQGSSSYTEPVAISPQFADSYFIESNTTSFLIKGIVRRVASSGEAVWEKTISHETRDVYLNGIVSDNLGGFFIFGGLGAGTDQPSLLIKISKDGQILWQKSALTSLNGYNYTHWTHADVDSSGNVYVSGWVSAFNNGNEQQSGIALVKYSSSGNVEWTRFLSTGRLVDALSVDSNGNIWVSSIVPNPYPTNNFITVAKYSSDGTLIFQKHITGSSGQSQQEVTLSPDPSGNMYLSVSVNGYQLIAKLDASCSIIWTKVLNLGSQIYASSTDDFGTLYLSGNHLNGPNFGSTITKILPNGTTVWQRYIYKTGGEYNNIAVGSPRSIDVDSFGNISYAARIRISNSYFPFIAYLPPDGSKTGTYSVGGQTVVYASRNISSVNQSFTISNASFASNFTVTINDYQSLPSISDSLTTQSFVVI